MSAPDLDTAAEHALDALQRWQREHLTERLHAVGTGVGLRTVGGRRRDELAALVFVDRKLPEYDLNSADIVPEEIELADGTVLPTDVQPVGEAGFRADAGGPMRGRQIRPMPGGVRIEVEDGSTGGVSALMHDRDGKPVLLTARHVADVTLDDPQGHEVYQPRISTDPIATVREGHTFSPRGTRRNSIDTALLTPTHAEDIRGTYLGYGSAYETGAPRIGERVVCFSPSAGMSTGDVDARGVEADLMMPWGREAKFSDLVRYDWDSEPGSSGSIIGRVNPSTRRMRIVGQHVGGADDSALMIPWDRIEREFGTLTPVTEPHRRVAETEVA